MKPDVAEGVPLAVNSKEIQMPVETIPEVIQSSDKQEDALSPFARLLQESKKKFNNNSN